MTEMVDTLYGSVSKSVFDTAKNIKLLICDVDASSLTALSTWAMMVKSSKHSTLAMATALNH